MVIIYRIYIHNILYIFYISKDVLSIYRTFSDNLAYYF